MTIPNTYDKLNDHDKCPLRREQRKVHINKCGSGHYRGSFAHRINFNIAMVYPNIKNTTAHSQRIFKKTSNSTIVFCNTIPINCDRGLIRCYGNSFVTFTSRYISWSTTERQNSRAILCNYNILRFPVLEHCLQLRVHLTYRITLCAFFQDVTRKLS